ncbi:type II toxin-antitoxin system RelE family toxin [Actinocorallia populi]|uniref:type II toxin-antitoxin system RelE family toxin n=1 Tax=Actinocorallia populi TaxID=2079200 RepID=UPI000D08EBCA|nr:type II toxin-antitoxin system RelE/ParE family toxin [Actinocorallia populi]
MLKIPRQDAGRILHRLTGLQKAMDAGDTSAFDIKALQGHNARRRLRVGDHRVVCTVEDSRLTVWVLAVGNRRDACRRLP